MSQRIVLALLFSLLVSSAWAVDYAKIIPENPLMFFRMQLGSFPFSPPEVADSYPTLKKAYLDMEKKIEDKTGFVFKRDLQELGFYVQEASDLNNPQPNGVIGYLAGHFQPEKLLLELASIRDLQISLEELGGFKVLRHNDLWGYFPNTDLLIFGTKDAIQKFQEGSGLGKGPSREIQECLAGPFGFQMKIRNGVGASLKNNSSVPKAVKDLLEKIETISVSFADKTIHVSFLCTDEGNVKTLQDFLENARTAASSNAVLQLADVDKRLGRATLLDLVRTSLGGEKIMFSMICDALKNLQLNPAGSRLQVMLPLPFEPGLFWGPQSIAITGILAAIAVPNLKKARETARMKSCYANMRVMLGAVEMYNMDNSTMMMNLDLDKLVPGYLKQPPTCPSAGTYSGSNLHTTGNISCTVHGSIPDVTPLTK